MASTPTSISKATHAPAADLAAGKVHHESPDLKADVWRARQKPQSQEKRQLTAEEKKLLASSTDIETIFNNLETSRSTPQHLIRLLRDYRHNLTPGCPMRERACSRLQEEYLREGKARTPEEAKELAEKTLHKRFAKLGALEQSLVAKIKEHPEMRTVSLKQFLADPRFGDTAKLLRDAKAEFLFIATNFITPAFTWIGNAVSKLSSAITTPASPFSESYQKAAAPAVPRFEVPQVGPQASATVVLSVEKPKGTAEVIAEANRQFSVDRVQKQKEAERKAEQHDVIDEKMKKRLAQAIHDALVECQRLASRGAVNFSPSIMHFVSKADLLALLRQIRQENAAHMVAAGSEAEKSPNRAPSSRF